MPTGYTAGVQDGSITEFSDYAMGCARAFGALIMMRDDPNDAEIPNEFEPSDYHQSQHKLETAELQEFLSKSDEELIAIKATEDADNYERYQLRVKTVNQHLERYSKMLAEAKAYKSPSPDHDKFSEFLVSQLQESIEFDCNMPSEPKPRALDEWKHLRERRLRDSIAYHAKGQRHEVERAESRSTWLRQLRESISEETV